MQIKLILVLTFAICIGKSYCQFKELHKFTVDNSTFDVFIIKVDSATKIEFVDNNSHLSDVDFWKTYDKKGQTFFGITASIVDSGCQPLGLFYNNGRKVKDINLGSGNGNFFLKPNGYIVQEKSGKVELLNSSIYKSSPDISSGIQSGPMLVSDGVINPSFDPSSKNRFIRCAVGLTEENGQQILKFARSIQPITFYEFAQLFNLELGCKNALVLESGNFSTLHFPLTISEPNSNNICRYLVIKL